MKRTSEIKLYNIMLPVWIIVFWPSWLWVLVIPLNYLIDRIVLRWSLGDMEDKGIFCRRHTWKICLAGFFSDFVGAGIMFAIFMSSAFLKSGSDDSFLQKLGYGVGFNPFSHVVALLLVLLCIAVSALLIYLIDKWILKKAGLSIEQAKRSAIRLALITAPYLYLFPSSLIYNNGQFII